MRSLLLPPSQGQLPRLLRTRKQRPPCLRQRRQQSLLLSLPVSLLRRWRRLLHSRWLRQPSRLLLLHPPRPTQQQSPLQPPLYRRHHRQSGAAATLGRQARRYRWLSLLCGLQPPSQALQVGRLQRQQPRRPAHRQSREWGRRQQSPGQTSRHLPPRVTSQHHPQHRQLEQTCPAAALPAAWRWLPSCRPASKSSVLAHQGLQAVHPGASGCGAHCATLWQVVMEEGDRSVLLSSSAAQSALGTDATAHWVKQWLCTCAPPLQVKLQKQSAWLSGLSREQAAVASDLLAVWRVEQGVPQRGKPPPVRIACLLECTS